MDPSARKQYLATDVLTATPQKLQLMLIEAAIRSAETARRKWKAEKNDEACEALIHAQDCIGEMLAGLNKEVDSELTRKVAALYVFVFRSLMEANYDRDEKKLDDALEVLKVERETWRQVCEKLGSELPNENAASVVSLSEQFRGAAAANTPWSPPVDFSAQPGVLEDPSTSGFSLEA
ncbi:MAG TPA: flagellar export chaperone FliS [Thermoguttaceae bacterium]|nr:flagellar export chaperone FliS [Thermoguttaceae bacterium]